MARSQFYGKRINPPNDTAGRSNVASTDAEREFALSLHNGMLHGEWRAIARRVTREFGIQRSDTVVKGWCVGR
jgi:hypothetical protein